MESDVKQAAQVRSAVTLSLVPEVRGGPFVFWDDTAAACEAAARIGFDGLELFPSTAATVPVAELRAALEGNGLALAAVGTGAGGVVHGLSLAHPDPGQRRRAIDFVRAVVELAASFGAPAIVGSMQGRSAAGEPREEALARLADSLAQLQQHAAAAGGRVLLEPLNRYETDLCNTLHQGGELLARVGGERLALLADLFHMNIEETDIAAALGRCRGAARPPPLRGQQPPPGRPRTPFLRPHRRRPGCRRLSRLGPPPRRSPTPIRRRRRARPSTAIAPTWRD